MKKPKEKGSIADRQIAGLVPLLTTGHVLSIDPSSGSRESVPGYSIWKAGVLIDSGVLDIHFSDNLNKKLFDISHSFRTEFDAPDVLVTELISSYMGTFSKSICNLQRSVGVVYSLWDCPIVEVSPTTWRKLIPENYQKGDESDAIMIGWTAIQKAFALTGRPMPSLPDWGLDVLAGHSSTKKVR